jgi:hypothetical protein
LEEQKRGEEAVAVVVIGMSDAATSFARIEMALLVAMLFFLLFRIAIDTAAKVVISLLKARMVVPPSLGAYKANSAGSTPFCEPPPV